MALNKILIGILFLIFIACTPQDHETGSSENQGTLRATSENLGKLFIIGGGSRPDSLVTRMIEEAGLNYGGYGIILPMASVEPDSAVFHARKQFVSQGIDQIVGFKILPGNQPTATALDSIVNADLIYISGGDQNLFMEIIKGTEVEHAILRAFNRGAVIAGTSAGAAVMSEKMITGNELKHTEYASTFENIESDNIEIKKGLGLIKTAIIDQHFIKRSRYNRLISAAIEYPELISIGIDESTALLVQGKLAEVIGVSQVVVLKNPLKSKKNKNGKIGAENIILNIYLAGEKFSLE